MNYTRILKKGSEGSDVKYMQSCLISLGYSCGSTKNDGVFGSNTENAVEKYQKSHKDTFGKALSVDGKIGEKTWYAIERDYSALNSDGTKYTRILKKGMTGNDVKYMQSCLIKMKYSCGSTGADGEFGSNTEKAVKEYQQEHKDTSGKALSIDGKIGEKTWAAIERDYKNNKLAPDKSESEETEDSTNSISLDDYTHISKDKREKIEKDLSEVSEIRQKIVLELLKYAYDKDISGDVRALYIFGSNMYDTKLNINYADEDEIDKAARIYPDYFTGGRKDWMKQQVKRSSTLPAADCSGCIVGYMRKNKLVNNSFDTTANNLCSNSYSSSISKSSLKPGDWVGYNGHVGTYIGGDYVVEFAGGAYGCQLTNLNSRKLYDFVNKKVKSGTAWNKFRKPKYY